MSWRELAACRGMDTRIFFPEQGEDIRIPKAVCESCPVSAECLAEAEENHELGVWGGTTRRGRGQRMAIRRPVTQQAKVAAEIQASKQWVSTAELANRLGFDRNNLGKQLARLAAQGKVEHEPGGYWRSVG